MNLLLSPSQMKEPLMTLHSTPLTTLQGSELQLSCAGQDRVVRTLCVCVWLHKQIQKMDSVATQWLNSG